MAKTRRGKLMNIPRELDDPLTYAVSSRDNATIDMVADALRHKHVMLAYQPIVQSKQPGRPAFYEGLIRILDDTGRVIPAKDFIDSIENTELGREVDCVALELGLRALRRSPDIRLSINMSARSVGYSRWTRILDRGLEQDETLAERLILEITESSAMLVPELVMNFMGELQRKGVTFALDDFGSGYTSFRYLRDFYFDIVKIDGQFIRGIHSNADNQVLTKALVAISQQFDMFTVAESVENAADAAWLANIGIDCQQGYLFGAPSTTPPWREPPAMPVKGRAAG